MKRIPFVIVLVNVLLWIACVDEDIYNKIRRDGYEKIELTGDAMYECEPNLTVWVRVFTATKNNKVVKGVVCGTNFLGYRVVELPLQ